MVQQAAKEEKVDAAGSTNGTGDGGDSTFCIVDLGTQSRKRVKNLKRGKGKLMEKVEDIVADLTEEDVISAGAQTVVVIVKQKAGFGDMFDD